MQMSTASTMSSLRSVSMRLASCGRIRGRSWRRATRRCIWAGGRSGPSRASPYWCTWETAARSGGASSTTASTPGRWPSARGRAGTRPRACSSPAAGSPTSSPSGAPPGSATRPAPRASRPSAPRCTPSSGPRRGAQRAPPWTRTARAASLAASTSSSTLACTSATPPRTCCPSRAGASPSTPAATATRGGRAAASRTPSSATATRTPRCRRAAPLGTR
mmetsp:Transcript_109634/g.309919  ORF Transcript_109634/g.309919 Transcript_109634/m.309919 type:complete len:219 (+) Transcript_109634:1307-1963(+)